MGKKKVITVSMREAALKKRLRSHLKSLGFTKNDEGILVPPGSSKDAIRAIHSVQRDDRLAANDRFISGRFPHLIKHFASGHEIDPARISPALQLVSSDTWEAELFRLASLTWSVPVSNGFGRRLRYLVWDNHNGKLIGIIAIGDPVFNLSVRDNLIKWDVEARGKRLVNVMDAYVLGALPPYNSLLGGKLVACLIRSRDIYDDFTRAYGQTRGIISKKKKNARLLAVTTSSSMGRSSVYNRLKLGGLEYFKAIGYTGGWGHFHIPDGLFAELRDYLRDMGHTYADQHRFGQGPNWRMRTTRAALETLGFEENTLRHGIEREVFLCQLASNALRILHSGRGRPNLSSLLSADDVAHLAVERWMLPRSQRMPEFKTWKRENIRELLGDQYLELPCALRAHA
ncbi:MAG: Druantia anti-phage system protein DruA [Candidatus Acidiferrales bacterium]